MKNIRRLLLIIAIQFAVTETVFSQCLIADYSFNGNANDASGNGNNGTVVNGTTLTTGHDGTPNSAYYFDAVDDIIEVNNTLGNFGISDYTISCWVKTSLQNGDSRFISKRVACVAAGSWFSLSLKNGIVVFETAESNNWDIIFGTTPVNDGNWHHVAVVRSGTLYTLYVDCNNEGSFNTPSLFNTSNNVPLIFGDDICTNVVPNGVKFTGSLDEIKIFDCALNTSEILALCSVPSQLCIIADYSFNGNANDASGNGNNGTVVNGTTLTTGHDGTPNSAYYFDAVDDIIEVNNTLGNFGISDYTISCWVKTSLQNGDSRFISKRVACVAAGSWFSLSLKNGIVVFETAESNNWDIIFGTTPVNDGNWHHVAVVRSGTLYTLYVDCNNEGSFNTPSLFNTSNNVPLIFGDDICTNVVPNGVKFTGSLDEIKIFDCALNFGELAGLCDITTNIVSRHDELNLQMYPNPTSGILNITTALKDNNTIQYQIINTLGAIVMANKVSDNNFSIDVNTLPTGIYFIQLQSGKTQTVKRFVKE